MSAAPRPASGRVALAFLLAAAAAIVFQLFVPPFVGLADEGDFAKIMGPVGLAYPTADRQLRYYRYVLPAYEIVAPWWPSGYLTSEAPLVAAARAGAKAAGARRLDIRAVGLLHAALLGGGFALLFSAARRLPRAPRLVFAAAILVFFTDVGYVALCNSLYAAAASLVFLLLAAGAAAGIACGGASRGLLAAYWLAALLFVTSKPQESIQAPILAALGFLLTRERRQGRLLAAALPAAALCLLGGLYYVRTPVALKSEALYNDLFFQVLLRSPDPAADLRELDLPASWIAHRGTHAYMARSALKDPAFRAELLARFGYRSLLRHALRHPDRALAVLGVAARRAFTLRPPYLGNYVREAGKPPGAQARAFGWWSAAKKRLSPAGPWLLPALWLANVAGAASTLRKAARGARSAAFAVLALAAMSAVAFLTCAFGDALPDVARHLHAFNAMTDLLLAADLAWLASLLSRLRPERGGFPASARRSLTPPLPPRTGGEEKEPTGG